ncbi:MAG: NAD-dependent epimerase/dehydratase family protein [Candidatus Nitrospinota bacterium M3_3B_026]
MSEEKPIIITGASGLVGAQLVRRLTGRRRLAPIYRKEPGHLPEGVVPTIADLADPGFAGLLPANADAIVHLAQSLAFRRFPEQADDIYAVNVASTQRLLEFGRRAGVSRLILASTGGVYPASPEPLREENRLDVEKINGYYARSKLAAEILAAGYAGIMKVVILRFFFIYGPGQRRDMLAPRLAASVREGRPITLQGPGGLVINPVHVDDAVNAVESSLRLEGDGVNVINVAGPEAITLRRMCEIIGERAGRPPVFSVDESGPAPRMVADISRMRALLGGPSITFAQGVKTLLE